MKYSVEINPEKEREFLEIMETLRRLEVVCGLKQTRHQHPFDRKAEHSISWQGGSEEEKSPAELADQYRDLVD